jgi:hypothetical protein
MNFLSTISNKKAVFIFIAACIINLLISAGIYFYFYFPRELNEYHNIAKFIIKEFEDKNLELKITKNGIEINQDPYFMESKNFPVSLNLNNIIYISKNANYADFKDKNTLAILNDKELVLNLNNEYQNLPVETILGSQNEILLNSDTVSSFINSNYLENSQIRNYLLLSFGLDRAISYITQFFWSYFVLGYALFYLFKFSGFGLNIALTKNSSLLFYAIFIIVEPIFSNLRFGINFAHVFVAGFLTLTFVLKKYHEKIENEQ